MLLWPALTVPVPTALWVELWSLAFYRIHAAASPPPWRSPCIPLTLIVHRDGRGKKSLFYLFGVLLEWTEDKSDRGVNYVLCPDPVCAIWSKWVHLGLLFSWKKVFPEWLLSPPPPFIYYWISHTQDTKLGWTQWKIGLGPGFHSWLPAAVVWSGAGSALCTLWSLGRLHLREAEQQWEYHFPK